MNNKRITLYKKIFISVNLQLFIKDLIEVKKWFNFIQLTYNTKYYYLYINWLNTSHYIQKYESVHLTFFKYFYYKAKYVKLIFKKLPIIEFLKVTKTNIYENS